MHKDSVIALLRTCQEQIENWEPHMLGPAPDQAKVWAALCHTHSTLALLSEVLYSLVTDEPQPPEVPATDGPSPAPGPTSVAGVR